jgi:hypothetical protein
VTPAPLNVTTALESNPLGVPGFGGGPVFVEPPPPHEATAIDDARASSAKAVLHRRQEPPCPATSNPIERAHANARVPAIVHHGPLRVERFGNCIAVLEGAVVWQVAVGVAVDPLPVRATEAMLKLQVVSEGSPENRPDDSGIVPVNPFIPVRIKFIVPEAPGLVTSIVAGLAVAPNVGAGVTVWAAVPDEVA